jgi:hypothetical protein
MCLKKGAPAPPPKGECGETRTFRYIDVATTANTTYYPWTTTTNTTACTTTGTFMLSTATATP